MDQNDLIALSVVAGAFLLLQLWKKMQRTDPKTIIAALAQGAIVIDVRSPAEFASGHYPGAVNVPLHLIGISADAVRAKPDQAIILYCASGMRSGSACRLLKAAGFTQVMNAGSLGDLPRQ